MNRCWDETIGSLGAFIAEQKAEPGKCTFSLVAFDDKYEQPENFQDIKLVKEEVASYGLRPRGNTALYDAIARAVRETGEKLRALPESLRPGKVLIITQTDGEENCSQEFSKWRGGAAALKKIITEQKEKYSWSFMFLGASEESMTDAAVNLGYGLESSAVYDIKNAALSNDLFSKKVKGLRSAKNQQEVFAATSYSAMERSALVADR